MNVTFIGGGVMAEALISGILDARVCVRITVSEPIPERRQQLASSYGIAVVGDNIAGVEGADMIVLSIKPQQLDAVAEDLGRRDAELPVVVSIMAGVQSKTIRQKLGCARIVRVMPNTPAQIGLGASAWTASPAVGEEALTFTKTMLEAVGEQVYFEDEKMVDIATALSASGPAYVFVFIESLVDGAVQLGMPVSEARDLAIQMVLGSASLAKETGKHPAELRNMVTSPGGTTAAALHALECEGFRRASIEAVLAAHRRGEALAKSTEG